MSGEIPLVILQLGRSASSSSSDGTLVLVFLLAGIFVVGLSWLAYADWKRGKTKPVSKGISFCPFCGNKITQATPYCPGCGKKIA
jgi:hypothetical protein